MEPKTRKERILLLSQPRTADQERWAELRAQREEEQTKECTFAPVVGRGPQQPFQSPASDRLFRDSEERCVECAHAAPRRETQGKGRMYEYEYGEWGPGTRRGRAPGGSWRRSRWLSARSSPR